MKLDTRKSPLRCSALNVGCWMFLVLGCSVSAQIQQAWVKRYSLNPAATNQATAIALAPDGGIIVGGSSASTNGDLDYVIVKYAPNGQQLWFTRYDSPTNGADQLRGMALDADGNVLLTGTFKTIKLNPDGGILWSVPNGGRAIALDTNGDAFVTGFSDLDFATVKLSPTGTNLWLKTYSFLGPTNFPDVSQVIAVGAGTVSVAGFETYNVYNNGSDKRIRVIQYDMDGNQLWTYATTFHSFYVQTPSAEAVSAKVGPSGRTVVTGNVPYDFSFATTEFDQGGAVQWRWFLDADDTAYIGGTGRAMTVNPVGNIYLTGSDSLWFTVKLGTNGHKAWLASYQAANGASQGNAITLDSAGGVVVTGYSPGSGSANDAVTLKYDSTGGQQWVQRYNGPANGNDIGTGVVVDSQGAVYVCGYSATTNGGTEFVTIKYYQLQNIQKKSDGSIQLQYFGTPSQNFAFQASTNLKNWDELGSSMAGTNGIAQFIDTNAPLFSWRFYRYYLP